MRKIAIVVNWVMLAIFGVAFVVMILRFPSSGGIGSLFVLAPYATALLAFKSNPHRGLIGASMFCNAVVVVFGVLFLVLSIFGLASGQVIAIIGCLVLIVPSAINSKQLITSWEQARAISSDRPER